MLYHSRHQGHCPGDWNGDRVCGEVGTAISVRQPGDNHKDCRYVSRGASCNREVLFPVLWGVVCLIFASLCCGGADGGGEGWVSSRVDGERSYLGVVTCRMVGIYSYSR